MEYTLEDVVRMRCFYADGKVYNPTGLIHPGGTICLERSIGQDCAHHLEMHSKGGRKLWDKYCIGKLKV